MRPIRKVAVLGAGTMGARIAAMFANAGVPTLLLDRRPDVLTPKETAKKMTLDHPAVRNRIAADGLATALKDKRSGFYIPESAQLITVGNFEDDMPALAGMDWIIEVIVEHMPTKKAILAKVDAHRRPGSIVTTNTSGLSINEMQEGRSDDFQTHFCGTHFFNPPRYMKLLEVIPAQTTGEDVIRDITAFAEQALGKRTVRCRDTLYFLANRVMSTGSLFVRQFLAEENMLIEEVDALTGELIGRPRSATFRLGDIVGIDISQKVIDIMHELLPDDEMHDHFVVPDLIRTLVADNRLGDKTGSGFYKKIKDPKGGPSTILVIDPDTMEYRERKPIDFPVMKEARKIRDTGERIKFLVNTDDRAGRFLWVITSTWLCYAANRIPEITDNLSAVDAAVRLGYAYELGPFQQWDALGVAAVVARLEKEGRPVPAFVRMLLDSGHQTFYKKEKGRTFYFHPESRDFLEIPDEPHYILLKTEKEKCPPLMSNDAATLVDIGDGVACLEFHSKMNTIDDGMIAMLTGALEKASAGELAGLVIGNQGNLFSAGANLAHLAAIIESGRFEEISAMVARFQTLMMALRRAPIPVVAAPFGMTLAGGCEIALNADSIQASAETYMGLVELGVGLIPAAGGCKEMIVRALAGRPISGMDLLPFLQPVFETIGMAKVSASGPDARKLGFLADRDDISMNQDRLIADAKRKALSMAAAHYRPPAVRTDIPALGRSYAAKLTLGLYIMKESGYASDYDQMLGKKLIHVLCGGDLTSATLVPEQHFLDLEREAFVSLCGEKKTQERILHMLHKGKPLRN